MQLYAIYWFLIYLNCQSVLLIICTNAQTLKKEYARGTSGPRNPDNVTKIICNQACFRWRECDSTIKYILVYAWFLWQPFTVLSAASVTVSICILTFQTHTPCEFFSLTILYRNFLTMLEIFSASSCMKLTLLPRCKLDIE